MEDAMMIELEEGKYKGKKRTAIVVYNGVEGNRVAIGKFEKKRESIEQAIGNKLLLRPIERWDINEITKRLFPHGKHFKKLEEYNMTLERMYAAVEIITDIKENVESFMFNEEPQKCKLKAYFGEILTNIEKSEHKFGPFHKQIDLNKKRKK